MPPGAPGRSTGSDGPHGGPKDDADTGATRPWPVRLSRSFSDLQKGIICILLVTLFFSGMDSCAKALGQRYEPFFVVWVRYAVQAVGALVIFAPQLPALVRTRHLGLQVVRSALLFTATLFFFSAFAVMPLADAIAVAQVAPLLITAFAGLFLAERIGVHRWTGVAVGFFGALVIVQPGTSALGLAALLPLAGATAFAAYSIATRFLGSEDSVWTTFLYTGSVGAIGASLLLPFVWEMPALDDLPLFLAVGTFGAVGQALLIIAFRYAPASLLAPFLYVSLIWAALFGFAFFDEVPGLMAALGAMLIVGSGLYVRHRERVRARAALGDTT